MPANIFCHQFYKNILGDINLHHSQKFLGKSQNSNNLWKEALSKDLYYAYAPKFIEQAKYVFDSTLWETDDLHIIRRELELLQASVLLNPEESVAAKLDTIRTSMKKYDEIEKFIISCNNFSFSDYNLDIAFPNDKVQKSKTYLNNELDDHYVNKCARLKNGLRQVPKKIYPKHLHYLTAKIAEHCENYTDSADQPRWVANVYNKLLKQIEDFENTTDYGIDTNDDCQILKTTLLECQTIANTHYGLTQ
jgi:uncharacterized membrane-anchored protein YjiN (DUF445 family)